MEEKELIVRYREYRDLNELDASDRELCESATAAMGSAFAPYSHFYVGAAVRLSDGTIVRGANQENSAYPSGLCAERTALFAAGANHPEKSIVSIALAGGPDGILSERPISPCGACRQVMAQYQARSGSAMSVIMVGAGVIRKFDRVEDILPFIFESI